MDNPLFIFIMCILQIGYWFIARRTSKTLLNEDDYFLASKSVTLFPLMMTFLATQVGGGIILGSADEAFYYGWSVIFYPLGSALGLIILGLGVGSKLAEYKVATIAELFEVVYQSKKLRKIASLLSIISLFFILMAQIIASKKFLVSLGFDSPFLFVIFWISVMIYTVQGGLKGVIATDIVQALFFIGVLGFCFGFIFYADFSSITQLSGLNTESVCSKLSGWLLMPLLFICIEQDMGQRCFAGISPKVISRAAFLSGVLTLFVCIIPVTLGILARQKGIEIPLGGSVLMTTVLKLTNPTLTTFVACAILAAIISTATSLINAISSNISQDFNYLSLTLNKNLYRVKIITSSVAISAIAFAFYFDHIVDLLIQSYELSVSCLFVPIFMTLFRKQGNYLAAFGAVLVGFVSFVVFRFYSLPLPKEILTLGFSFMGYFLVQTIIRIKQHEKNEKQIDFTISTN